MEIRLAELSDLVDILKVKEVALEYLKKTNNEFQWINGYPSEELLKEDILSHSLYVITLDNVVHAFFYFANIIDPTYINLYEGNWIDNSSYYVIHRISSDGTIKNVFKIALDFALKFTNHIRIDTKSTNLTMLHLLNKHGFIKCGKIFIDQETDNERIAFELIR